MLSLVDAWPLFGLSLRTPHLELHPVRDEDLPLLTEAALAGIHDPAEMPFGRPWTDAPRDELIRGLARHQWRLRDRVAGGSRVINFAICVDGQPVGIQDVSATDFALRRTVTTGSWLTRSMQGRGLGTEMRAAALLFAFDHLGAEIAETGAAEWNARSRGVSRRLGYRENGVHRRIARPDEVVSVVDYRMTPADLVRPEWLLEVTGLDAVRGQLGIA